MTPRAPRSRGQRYLCSVCRREWYAHPSNRDWHRRWCVTCQAERTFERTFQRMAARVWPPPRRKEEEHA